MKQIRFFKCTRCHGIFDMSRMTECYSGENPDVWLADLCEQCIEGWEFFSAFVGEHE